MFIEIGIDSLSSVFLLQRMDDSLVLSVEPDTLTVGQFITEGYLFSYNLIISPLSPGLFIQGMMKFVD